MISGTRLSKNSWVHCKPCVADGSDFGPTLQLLSGDGSESSLQSDNIDVVRYGVMMRSCFSDKSDWTIADLIGGVQAPLGGRHHTMQNSGGAFGYCCAE